MTRSEDLLASVLRDRVDGREVPSTRMGVVVSTAGRIRRRRRARAGVAVAAVVAAVAAPFVVAASRSTDTSIEPSAPSSTSSTRSVRMTDVERGEPPATPWLDGRDLVAADGGRTTLPFDHVVRVAPYRGGFVVAVYGDRHVTWLGPDLAVRERWCGHGSFAVSADESSTAFAVSEATPSCDEDDADVTLHLGPTRPSGTPDQTRPVPATDAALVGVLGNTVAVSPYDGAAPSLLDLDGTSTPVDELSSIGGVDARLGLVSGQLAGGAGSQSLGVVLDPSSGDVPWTKPGWQMSTFSPDGSTVLGVQSGGPDRPPVWGVFDVESGTQLHELTIPAGFVPSQVVWEDDDHLLMATTQGATQAIVRTDLEGTLELATDAVPFDGDPLDVRHALTPNAFL